MKLETEAEVRAYYQGKRDGIWLFAWWQDGKQQVGTCGTTLEEAIGQVDADEKAALELLMGRRKAWPTKVYEG